MRYGETCIPMICDREYENMDCFTNIHVFDEILVFKHSIFSPFIQETNDISYPRRAIVSLFIKNFNGFICKCLNSNYLNTCL